MKLMEIRENPKLQENEIKKVASFIKENCQPFLKQWNQKFLYRGMRNYIKPPYEIYEVRKNRKPRDTPPIIHKTLDDHFLKKYGHKYRSNSLFAAGSSSTVMQFGTPHRIFPIGNFDFIWHPDVYDLLDYIHDEAKRKFDDYNDAGNIRLLVRDNPERAKEITNEIISNIQFIKNKRLADAIELDNEIMINCDQYVVLANPGNPSLNKQLIDELKL